MSKNKQISTNNYISKIVNFLKNIASSAQKSTFKIYRFITRNLLVNPIRSFVVLMASLVILTILSNYLARPKNTSDNSAPGPKVVNVFGIGSSPTINAIAKVDKNGVITLVAQTSGIVQRINKIEGEQISKGESALSLSTNYQGANIPSLSRQIAQKNFDFVNSNFDAQISNINRRREIANATDAMSDELRNITNLSLDDTRNSISLNEDILNTLNDQISYLEQTNVSGANDSLILTAKSSKSQVQGALTTLRTALRNSIYQGSSDNKPAELANISKDLTLTQLDLEEKSLNLNKELAELNLKIARSSESLMYPASPVSGIVEKINVQYGDLVSPGTVLATISCDETTTNLVVNLPPSTASQVSKLDASKIYTNGKVISSTPRYISSEAVGNGFYAVFYTITGQDSAMFTDATNVRVEIPLVGKSSLGSITFIPIDSIYQTNSESLVFVATKSATSDLLEAKSITITLGNVVGSFVEVLSGLVPESQVILDRTVVDGDIVTTN